MASFSDYGEQLCFVIDRSIEEGDSRGVRKIDRPKAKQRGRPRKKQLFYLPPDSKNNVNSEKPNYFSMLCSEHSSFANCSPETQKFLVDYDKRWMMTEGLCLSMQDRQVEIDQVNKQFEISLKNAWSGLKSIPGVHLDDFDDEGGI